MFLLQAFGRSFWLTVVGAIAAMAVSGSALTAGVLGDQSSNTASAVTTIGGYTVNNVAYVLGATPTDIASITFQIASPPAQPNLVRVQAVSPAGTWYTCSLAAALPNYNATCTTAGLTVAAANNLTVVVSK